MPKFRYIHAWQESGETVIEETDRDDPKPRQGTELEAVITEDMNEKVGYDVSRLAPSGIWERYSTDADRLTFHGNHGVERCDATWDIFIEEAWLKANPQYDFTIKKIIDRE